MGPVPPQDLSRPLLGASDPQTSIRQASRPNRACSLGFASERFRRPVPRRTGRKPNCRSTSGFPGAFSVWNRAAFTPSTLVAGESGAVGFPASITLAVRREDSVAGPQAPKAWFQKAAEVEPTLSASPAPGASSPEPRDFATLAISPRVPRLTAGRKVNAGSVELGAPPIDRQILRVHPRTLRPLPPAPVHGRSPLETKGFNPLPAGSPRLSPERELTARPCELPQSPLSAGVDPRQPKPPSAQPVDLTVPVPMASTVPFAPASPEQHQAQAPRPVSHHLQDTVPPREPERTAATMRPVDSARFGLGGIAHRFSGGACRAACKPAPGPVGDPVRA